MTSYGSYNDTKKPIIMDNFIIAISNSCLSFVAGFAVFSIIGYLNAQGSPVSSSMGSISLAFIAYPTAITMLPWSHFWSILLFVTLYTLGLDSAFSMVEATSTVIFDTQRGENKPVPRMIIALTICVVGCLCAIPFVSNFGL